MHRTNFDLARIARPCTKSPYCPDDRESTIRLQDRVFVVTGASDGIGQHVALELLRRGARVAGVGRNIERLQATVAMASAPERMSVHMVDIADRACVLALPDEVIAAHGAVDAIVNVAGVIQPFESIESLDISQIDRVMDINFYGALNMAQAFLPLLKERTEAAIVNVSSMGALVPVPGQGAYGASKAALSFMTEALHAELRRTNVVVTLVLPGAIDTNIAANSGADIQRLIDAVGTVPTMKAVDASARTIIRAIERGRFRVIIGRDARLVDLLARISPSLAIRIVAWRLRALLG